MEMGRNVHTNVKPLLPHRRLLPNIQHTNDKLSTKLLKLGLFIYHFFEACFQKCGICKDDDDDETVMCFFILFCFVIAVFLLSYFLFCFVLFCFVCNRQKRHYREGFYILVKLMIHQ